MFCPNLIFLIGNTALMVHKLFAKDVLVVMEKENNAKVEMKEFDLNNEQ